MSERRVLDIAEGEPRLAQAIADGFGGKAGPVLDAAEALFLRRGDERRS